MARSVYRLPQKIKVCCLCEKWESGGIESYLYNVLLHMDLSHLEIDIAAAQLTESVFTEPLRACGVRFYQLSGKLRSLTNERAFSDLLKARNYNVVYLNIFHGLSYRYGYLAKKAGVPIRIAHSHGAGLRKSPGKIFKLCLHQLGKRLWASSITDFWVCSRNAARFLVPKGQTYQWIPNGIETERFRFQSVSREKTRYALGVTEDTFLLGTVGRLSEEKNHSFLLKVFYEFKNLRENSVLLLIGTGNLEKQLRREARELSLEEDVIFYGTSSQVEQLLWAMDIFIFPSQVEGLGIAGVEAQAAGLPVLCSKAIPPEALVTKSIAQLDLSAGPRTWAEKALRLKSTDRKRGAEVVAAAGFDAKTVAGRIKKRWMEQ